MDQVKKEISQAEYLSYVSNPAAYRREREKTIPVVWKCGYGWYGCECHESNGKYYRTDLVGESCD